MTILETTTHLPPAEVIERARAFFALNGTPYTAFVEMAGENHLRLRLDMGEIVIAAYPVNGATRVRGTASRGGHLLGRFLTTLGPPLEVRHLVRRRTRLIDQGARVFLPPAGAPERIAAPAEQADPQAEVA